MEGEKKMRKVLILDAGPIINLSMNGLLEIFEKINQKGITIAITNYVYQEVVDRPSHIPRFELGALKIKDLIEKGVIKYLLAQGFFLCSDIEFTERIKDSV